MNLSSPSSFPRKRESSVFDRQRHWVPACAGTTYQRDPVSFFILVNFVANHRKSRPNESGRTPAACRRLAANLRTVARKRSPFFQPLERRSDR
jgi:hypothetical protein